MSDGADVVRRRLLGRGLACPRIDPTLDHGRDLVLAMGPGGLDLAPVEGLDNLSQCLEVALTTALGDDVFNIGFGFDGIRALAEETSPVLVRERIRVAVIRVLADDARVLRIIDLKLLDGRLEPGSPSGGADAAARADRWRTVRVDVAFETVSGERVVVGLQGGSSGG
jgi:hypothetical protein